MLCVSGKSKRKDRERAGKLGKSKVAGKVKNWRKSFYNNSTEKESINSSINTLGR